MINQWLEFKYILVYENSRRFIPHMFNDERIASYSYVRWFPVSNTVRTDIVKMIVRSQMDLNDYYINIGNVKIDDETGFTSDTTSTRILPYKNQMQNAITYELSQTRVVYTRTVYSILDFFSDIGGLQGALAPFFAIFVGIF